MREMTDGGAIRFPHKQGRDCATASMRNILHFYGVNLSESMVFGLGYGLTYWFCSVPEAPFPVILGQNVALEEELCTNLGVRLVVHDPGLREETDVALLRVQQGVPTIVKADPYYLDYCWNGTSYAQRQHFGEHVLVVVGISGDFALVSDIWSDELELVPLSQLHAARSASVGLSFLQPRNRWYELRFPEELIHWQQRIVHAAAEVASRMLKAQGYFGLAGIRRTGPSLCSWIDLASQEVAPKGLEIIARRMDEGATGSCFRALFSEFLIEGGQLLGDARLLINGQEWSRTVPRWQEVTKRLYDLSRVPHAEAVRGLRDLLPLFQDLANQEERLCRQLVSALQSA